jgi:hypothetical protein
MRIVKILQTSTWVQGSGSTDAGRQSRRLMKLCAVYIFLTKRSPERFPREYRTQRSPAPGFVLAFRHTESADILISLYDLFNLREFCVL